MVLMVWMAQSALGAIQPDRLYEVASKSVFVVEAIDDRGRTTKQGSAVVVGRRLLVTNCHVVSGAKRVDVRRADRRLTTELTSQDTARDLCLLKTREDVGAGVATRSSSTLRVGERVYAIGSPLGLELTMSEGLVSSLRKADDGFLIQTNAAISPGSSGGGLFDADARLIGITSFQKASGQNLNFALPAEWISAADERATKAFAARQDQASLYARAHDAQDRDDWQSLLGLGAEWASKFPSHIGGWAWTGRALEMLGRKDEAVGAYRRATGASVSVPEDALTLWLTYIWLGQIYRANGSDASCADAYAEAMLLVPDDLIYGNLYHCLVRSGDAARSVEVHSAIASRHPQSKIGWIGLGRAYLTQRKPQDAERAFRELLAIDPSHVQGLYGLVLAKGMMGDKDGVVSAIERLEKANPEMAEKLLKSFDKQ